MNRITWRILRDFEFGTTTVTLTGILTQDEEPRLADLLFEGGLDAPLALIVDLNAIPPSNAATVAAFLGRWASDRPDGPELVLSVDTLAPTGRLLRATLGNRQRLRLAATGESFRCESSDPRRAHLRLAADNQSPAAGRRLIAHHCRNWGMHSTADRAMVVASELISNAVMHAETEVDITVAALANVLRISVRDRTKGVPRPTVAADSDQLAEGGRGLPIINALANDWGFFAFGDGKTVWAQIDSERP
ncbi:ATP-binding protein [Micromonospora vinacea]|uniref:Anti-sigma regulatory factor (Ser/Thr protein kinase) n=1 Tax=Micromonospora vinacea TaxID=709878 RepID=A0ABS0KBH7_9ACTN|nr:ATP-binding protein [Micromonospora vinacea]MBG6105850.1 anti-sigma regulatory factor (Ser/Thr protein kinase) [Micromonospora vinacea]